MLQLFLTNQVRESFKQGIQAAWSAPIHHVKLWISRFRGVYRDLTASGRELFLILLKGFRPFCNVTRSSVVGCCGHSISASTSYYYCYIIAIITITFIVNIIFIIFIIIRIFITSSLLFLWGKLTVWFCFFQFLQLS